MLDEHDIINYHRTVMISKRMMRVAMYESCSQSCEVANVAMNVLLDVATVAGVNILADVEGIVVEDIALEFSRTVLYVGDMLSDVWDRVPIIVVTDISVAALDVVLPALLKESAFFCLAAFSCWLMTILGCARI